jgi:hypothetical protein
MKLTSAICPKRSTQRPSQASQFARVAKLADAPDLGSGGAILRGSSPLPGIWTTRSRGSEIKITLSLGPVPVIMRDAVGRSRQLRADIHVVAGTAITTVTSALIFGSDTFFSVTRQSVPLEANGQLRFAEDEGYVRIG